MNLHGKDIKIFAGNSNKALAEEIAEKISLPLGMATVGKFSDGEPAINIGEVVRGSDVFIVQSTCPPVNDNLMELLIMIDAIKRASAGRITAVMPYFGYARQDRKAKARDPISAKLVANLLTTAGADRILTMDLHAPQLQGFFDIPVDHLLGLALLAQYFKEKFTNTDDVVVVSPDVGSVSRCRKFAERLDIPLAIIDKRRPKANVCEIMNIIGDVKNKKVILVDDLIDTAGTIVNGVQSLMDMGAKEVYACCTHAVLSGPAIERIKNSQIKELVILNTIPLSDEKRIDKIKTLSVAGIFAEAIERIYGDISISTLFTQQDVSNK
jgi:ribose-phosphate pyrophosphokinase